jgi:hypothetical protein
MTGYVDRMFRMTLLILIKPRIPYDIGLVLA